MQQQNTAPHTLISPQPSSSSSHSHTESPAPLSKKCIIPSPTTEQDPEGALRALLHLRRSKHNQIGVQQPYDDSMTIIRPSCGDEKNDTVSPDARREREREKGEQLQQIGMSGSGGEQRELSVWKGGMGGEGVVEGRVVEGELVEGRGMVGVVLLMVVVVVLLMGLGLGVLGWRCWVRWRKRRAGRRMMRPWDERVEEGVLLDDMFRD